MDTGTVKFTVTLKTLEEWGSAGRAYIDFPNYYVPCLGRYVTCGVEDTAGAAVEVLYCAVRWDHSLVVYGPTGAALKKDTAFVIRVDGVSMND
jgi:hypothetical protein